MAERTVKKTINKKGRARAKFLDAYYGHVAKDMKLIVITGSTGKTTVAHFVHHILTEAGQRVAVLASDSEIKVGMFHKFLSDAWKAGANYVVVTAPAESLNKNVFYNLPIYLAAMTDYIPAGLDDKTAEQYELAEDTLFDMNPNYVVLNRDDKNYSVFSNTFKGTEGTVTYGTDHYSDISIEGKNLYKKGTEAKLSINGLRTTVASFIPGEPTVHYMAAAAAIATALHIASDPIEAGIADYNPEEYKS